MSEVSLLGSGCRVAQMLGITRPISVCLSIYLSIHLNIFISIFVSIYLSIDGWDLERIRIAQGCLDHKKTPPPLGPS